MFKIEELSSLDRRGNLGGVIDDQRRSDSRYTANELGIPAVVGSHLLSGVLVLLNIEHLLVRYHSQMNNFLVLPIAEACDLDLGSKCYFFGLGHVIVELYIYALISNVYGISVASGPISLPTADYTSIIALEGTRYC
jgi:hypothetical protein